jgi:hypothetical protein
MCRLFIGFVWHNAGQNQFYFPLIGRFPADCPVSFSAFAGGLRSRALRVRAGFFLFAADGRGVIRAGDDQHARQIPSPRDVRALHRTIIRLLES